MALLLIENRKGALNQPHSHFY